MVHPASNLTRNSCQPYFPKYVVGYRQIASATKTLNFSINPRYGK